MDDTESRDLDPRTRRKLRDFGRAVEEAIAENTEAAQRLRELRREGYNFYLLVGGEEDEGDVETFDAGAEGGAEPERPDVDRSDESTVPASRALQISRRQLPARRSPQRPPLEREPAFRINGGDVALLRSLGIDPTRRAGKRGKR